MASAGAKDLDLFLSRLEEVHPEPFHGISRSDFVDALRALQDRLRNLDADETTVEVMRLVALLSRAGRDGHQFALPQPGHEGAVLPLRIYEFDEGVFVTAAMPGASDIVGAELLAIGDTDIEEVVTLVEPLVPRDGPSTVAAFRSVFLLRTEVLRGLGVLADSAVTVTIRHGGTERTVEIDPADFDAYVSWAGEYGMFGLPDRADTTYLSGTDEILRAEQLPGSSAAYLRYTRVERPAASALEAARALLTNQSIDRAILDVRQNPGGDNHNNPSMIKLVTDFVDAHPGAPVVVLTDRVTFSAAANLVTDIEGTVDPVFVGEAMGGGLNFWNDVTQVRFDDLPVPMQIGVSTKYWERSTPGDERLTIEPDVAVPVTAADYFGGRDPALAAAAVAPAS